MVGGEVVSTVLGNLSLVQIVTVRAEDGVAVSQLAAHCGRDSVDLLPVSVPGCQLLINSQPGPPPLPDLR